MVKRILNQEEPLRVVIGVVLIGMAALTYMFVQLFSKKGTCSVERFEGSGDTEKEDGTFGGIMASVKRVSGILLQPGTWTDRIEMHSMSPTELARRYLKSTAKAEDDGAA